MVLFTHCCPSHDGCGFCTDRDRRPGSMHFHSVWVCLDSCLQPSWGSERAFATMASTSCCDPFLLPSVLLTHGQARRMSSRGRRRRQPRRATGTMSGELQPEPPNKQMCILTCINNTCSCDGNARVTVLNLLGTLFPPAVFETALTTARKDTTSPAGSRQK
jgi:hypothetical protein